MSEIGVIQVPKVRWGGRWMDGLRKLASSGGGTVGEWTELTPYAGTSSYQVARALNLGSELPLAPAGQRYEFGSRRERNGTSTLLVRVVSA